MVFFVVVALAAYRLVKCVALGLVANIVRSSGGNDGTNGQLPTCLCSGLPVLTTRRAFDEGRNCSCEGPARVLRQARCRKVAPDMGLMRPGSPLMLEHVLTDIRRGPACVPN